MTLDKIEKIFDNLSEGESLNLQLVKVKVSTKIRQAILRVKLNLRRKDVLKALWLKFQHIIRRNSKNTMP